MMRNERYIHNDIELTIPMHINYGKYILDRIRKQPKENIALINGIDDSKMTYGELTQYAVNLAVSLADLGVGLGHVVAICSESRNEFIATIIGVLLTGATYTPFNYTVGKANLRHKLNLSKPQHIIYTQSFWNTYKDILDEFQYQNYISIDDTEKESEISIKTWSQKKYDVNQFQPVKVLGQTDVAMIVYTSGSTGFPKGVMITHLACILCLLDTFDDIPFKTSINIGDWCGRYGSPMGFRLLTAGKTVVYLNGEVEILLKCLHNYKVDVAILCPSLIYELVNLENLKSYDLESLKFITSGGSPMYPDLRNMVAKTLPHTTLINGYGMTEVFELASERHGVPGLKPKSVGKVAPAYTVKVVDLLTREVLGPNQHGEICVETQFLFKGYIGMNSSTYFDKEGFFKTGDLGYFDDDGYIFIIDRIKELIDCRGGFKVAPAEIDMILLSHPGVKDAGVVGKPVDCEVLIAAFVVKESGQNVSEQDINDLIVSEAPDYVRLEGGVHFVAEIPRNSAGKIKRPELKQMLDS